MKTLKKVWVLIGVVQVFAGALVLDAYGHEHSALGFTLILVGMFWSFLTWMG